MISSLHTKAVTLLQTVRKEASTASLRQEIASLGLDQLKTALSDDQARLAFWINLYNAFFLILRKEDGLERPAIYREQRILVAGVPLSLDDIEHGILRRFRWKWSLGYLPNPFYRKAVRQLAVQKLDPRIHFALNCGAKSCPPIAFYDVVRIDAQLDMATGSFLESETEIKEEEGVVLMSRLFLWYHGDFGGEPGTRRMLKKYLDAEVRGLKIQFSEYNWDEDLENWWGV